MKFLDESLKQDYFPLYVTDMIVFFIVLSICLFIILECIFYEGSLKITTPHIVSYYAGMFSLGYLFSRCIFTI